MNGLEGIDEGRKWGIHVILSIIKVFLIFLNIKKRINYLDKDLRWTGLGVSLGKRFFWDVPCVQGPMTYLYYSRN